jgi:hypothetical protein
MTKSARALDIVFAVGFGLLAVAAVGVSTPSSAGPYEAQMTHETVTIVGIDRDKRTATLKNSDGETKTVRVPPEMKNFDNVKIGDKIDIDYYESVAVKLLPKGARPSVSQSSSGMQLGQPGTATGTRETTIAAEIVKIDSLNNKITFKGPQGNIQSVTVSDPDIQKKLPMLKVGQVVQLTYSEAIAASLRKTDSQPSRAPGEQGSTKQKLEQQQPMAPQ